MEFNIGCWRLFTGLEVHTTSHYLTLPHTSYADYLQSTSFWGFLFVGTFIVGFVCGWLSAAYEMGWMIPLVIYTFLAVGGTWASAENYKKKQLSKQQSVLWGILAQIVCVLNVVSLIATIVDMF